MNYYIKCIINLFRSNKEIPNTRPKPQPYSEVVKRVRYEDECIIIYTTKFTEIKELLDVVNKWEARKVKSYGASPLTQDSVLKTIKLQSEIDKELDEHKETYKDSCISLIFVTAETITVKYENQREVIYKTDEYYLEFSQDGIIRIEDYIGNLHLATTVHKIKHIEFCPGQTHTA